MKSRKLISVVFLLRAIKNSFAHMEMIMPPPIKSKYNIHYDFSHVDYSYNDPLGVFPCKGYHLYEPHHSTARYIVGEKQLLIIEGAANHEGGSCQISLSYDEGDSFTVIKSIIGGCPLKYSYDFIVPKSAPSGQALLSWTWISHNGNRDLYQNCAWVDIVNAEIDEDDDDAELDGPDMFIAQLPGSCIVAEGYDFIYPHPGQQVEYGGSVENYTIICEECSQRFEGSQRSRFNPEVNNTCIIRNHHD